jgi:hypothetical protein
MPIYHPLLERATHSQAHRGQPFRRRAHPRPPSCPYVAREMWNAIFGSSEPAEPPALPKKTPEELAAQKEARKKKAAEARKKREAQEAAKAKEAAATKDGDQGPTGFAFARKPSASASSESQAAANLPAISEDAVVLGLEQGVRESLPAASPITSPITPKAAAAQQSNVVDLMKQVRLQHNEELNAAVGAVREETTKLLTAELESKFATTLAERLREAQVQAEVAKEKAVADCKEQTLREAADRQADALVDAEAKHATEKEAALKEAAERHAKEIAKLTQELEAQHDLTRAASAALLRRAEVDGDSKREQLLNELRVQLAEEAAADKQAAVKEAEAATATKLAEARIEFVAEKESAIASAVAEAEAALSKKLEAEHEARTKKLADRLARFNTSFKVLLKRLVDQPQEASIPKPLAIQLASAQEQAAELATAAPEQAAAA